MHLQVVVTTNDDRPIYYFHDNSVPKSEQKIIRTKLDQRRLKSVPGFNFKKVKVIDDQYKIVVILSNKALTTILIKKISIIVEIAIIILVALLISFIAIFSKYRTQLKRIIDTTKMVSSNNLDMRIDIADSKFEDLTVLSTSINRMLDEISNNINTIYKLKIAQQEAHMKSLQSQISPHFMANTLEYIRMSALDSGNKELAKVIYNFAALLRSNVGSEIQTTLKKEIKLIGNYIYLYQVRFPDKLAYQINVESKLEKVKLPKFSLQPIVENYFVHGVNFANMDNAIEIKAFVEDKRVVLRVEDNGNTLSEKELEKLNKRMTEPIVEDKSIGLQNVYARMKNYTKNFRMKIENNKFGGVSVELSFDYEA